MVKVYLSFLLLLPSVVFAKPKMTVKLVAEDISTVGTMAIINVYVVLPDGTHASGHCTTTGPRQCIIDPFAPEKRVATSCSSSALHIQARCFSSEVYFADRRINDLTIHAANGAVTFHIDGTWDSFQPSNIPSSSK